jgi:hypothetical protein
MNSLPASKLVEGKVISLDLQEHAMLNETAGSRPSKVGEVEEHLATIEEGPANIMPSTEALGGPEEVSDASNSAIMVRVDSYPPITLVRMIRSDFTRLTQIAIPLLEASTV